MNVFVHLLHDFQRQLAHQRPVGDQKDRNLLIAPAYSAQNFKGCAFIKLVVSLEIPIQQNRTMRWIGGDER